MEVSKEREMARGISIEYQELLLVQFCTRISRENASSFGVTTNPLSLVSNRVTQRPRALWTFLGF